MHMCTIYVYQIYIYIDTYAYIDTDIYKKQMIKCPIKFKCSIYTYTYISPGDMIGAGLVFSKT